MNRKDFFSYYLFLLVISVFFLIQKIQSQNIYSSYDKIIGTQNREVLNGKIRENRFLFVKGNHPFFDDNIFINGNIIFNNQFYNLDLKYDILNDIVLTPYTNHNVSYSVELKPSAIQKFEMGKHIFIRLSKNKSINNIYRNGFFEEIIINKNYRIYIKYIKKLIKDKTSKYVRYKLLDSKIFIIYSNGNYFSIKNKRDLKKVFPKQKIKIKNYLINKRINRINLINLIKTLNID